MQVNETLSNNFLDVLFEGRNKDYGAYELRKSYNKRMAIAVTGMAAICLLFFLTHLMANKDDKGVKPMLVTEIKLDPFKPEPEVKRPELPKVAPAITSPKKAATIQYTPPVIIEDRDARDAPPAVEDLDGIKIGVANQDGIKGEDFVAPPVEAGTGTFDAPKRIEEDVDKVFTRVEKEARFPGGSEAWKKYLERNLNGDIAVNYGAPMGRYTVKVQFIVDKEGGISNVQAIEVPKACLDCGTEAIKVIKKGPKWEPAVQNGTKVIYQAIQYVTFEVAEE